VVQLRDMVSEERQEAGWGELSDRLLVAGDRL
jgi:hypothetical protein